MDEVKKRWVLLIAAGLAIGVLAIILSWGWLIEQFGRGGDGTFRLVTVMAGLFAFLLAGWRTVIAERQAKAATDQAASTYEQIKIVQKGQYSERFVKAVEQVANDRLAVRLGGLESLRALSDEDGKEYGRVWNYLGNFLRHPPGLRDWPPKGDLPKTGEETPIGQRPDIVTIVTMINERDSEQMEKKGGFRLPLNGAKLQGADLRKANLEKAELQGAHLQEAHLQEANLQEANLQKADLRKANLEKAELQGAHLQEASLQEAQLQDAKLQEANLQKADLRKANLQKANLRLVKLQAANMQGADLRWANLQEADLQEANMQGVLMQKVDLQEANLQKADLTFALFDSTGNDPQDLTRCMNLNPDQMKETFHRKGTILPAFPEWKGAPWPEDCQPQPIPMDEWNDKRNEWFLEQQSRPEID